MPLGATAEKNPACRHTRHHRPHRSQPRRPEGLTGAPADRRAPAAGSTGRLGGMPSAVRRTRGSPVTSELSAVTRQIGPVAVGLGVLGLASFAFLSVSGRALGPAELAPLGTLWILVNALGPALFQPLEQEVGRAVAHRAAHGQGARPVFLRACGIAAGVVVLAAAVLFVVRKPLADEVFAGQEVLVLALLLGLVGLGAEHLTRGAFAGGGAFHRYGTQLAVDGVLRIGSAA